MWRVVPLLLLVACIRVEPLGIPPVTPGANSLIYVVRASGSCAEPNGEVVYRSVRAPSDTTVEFTFPSGALLFVLASEKTPERVTHEQGPCSGFEALSAFCAEIGEPLELLSEFDEAQIFDETCKVCPKVDGGRGTTTATSGGRPRGIVRLDDERFFVATSADTFVMTTTSIATLFDDFRAESFTTRGEFAYLGGAQNGRASVRRVNLSDARFEHDNEDLGPPKTSVRAIAEDETGRLAVVLNTSPDAVPDGKSMLMLFRTEEAQWTMLATSIVDKVSGEDIGMTLTDDGTAIVAAESVLLQWSPGDTEFRMVPGTDGFGRVSTPINHDGRIVVGSSPDGALSWREKGGTSFQTIALPGGQNVDRISPYRTGYLVGAGSWFGFVEFDNGLVCELQEISFSATTIYVDDDVIIVAGRAHEVPTFVWLDPLVEGP